MVSHGHKHQMKVHFFSPGLFNLYVEHMQKAGVDSDEGGVKIGEKTLQ